MKIRVSQLKDGHHTFRTSEKASHFGLDDAQRYAQNVDVTVELDKRGQTYYLQEIVHTVARFQCDRCLDPFSQTLDADYRVIYTSDRSFVEMDEDIRFIAPDESEIDITDDIRETVLLAVPIKLLCKQDCKGLCPNCGANLNYEHCNCQTHSIDPRWEALKKLLE